MSVGCEDVFVDSGVISTDDADVGNGGTITRVVTFGASGSVVIDTVGDGIVVIGGVDVVVITTYGTLGV